MAWSQSHVIQHVREALAKYESQLSEINQKVREHSKRLRSP